MYVIFIAEKPFIIAAAGVSLPTEFADSEVVSPKKFFRELPFILMEENNHNGRVCFCTDVEEAWDKFTRHFVLITAAGGVVENEKGELLFIYRNGKWDMAKGKTEKGENMEECALREVKEECGIKKLNSLGFLITTYHTYNHVNSFYLKQTDWFSMTCSSKENLVPQKEEGIEKIAWFPKIDLSCPMAGTYASIELTVRSYLNSTSRF